MQHQHTKGSAQLKTIIIYGGGMAGTFLAKQLCQDFAVTLVDSNEYFEIPMATPRSIIQPTFAEAAIIPFAEALPQVKHIQGCLTKLHPDCSATVELASGEQLHLQADLNVLATGSQFNNSLMRGQKQTKQQRLAFYQSFADQVKKAEKIILVGGGPIGVEVAGEINEQYPHKQLTIVEAGPRLLAGTANKVSCYAAKDLSRRGVKILTQTRLVHASHPPSCILNHTGQAKLSTGDVLDYDLIIWCTGGQPNTQFMQAHFADVLNAKQQIQVQPSLQVTGYSHLFALGDITDLAENKMAWHINGQIPVAASNIRRILTSKQTPLKHYRAKTNNPMMAVTLGSQKGVVYLPIIGMINIPFITKMAKAGHMLVPKYRKELGLSSI